MAERGARDAFRIECHKEGELGRTLETDINPKDSSQSDTARTPKDLCELLIYQ
jgi:hypothetical protein